MAAFLALGILVSAMQVGTAAAGRPDFSGRWVPVTDRGSDPERVRIVKQDDRTVTVWEWADGSAPNAYRLDGAEQAAMLDRMPAISTVRWEGAQLVIERRVREPEKRRRWEAVARIETWSLDPRRGVLRIDIRERSRGSSRSVHDSREYRRQ